MNIKDAKNYNSSFLYRQYNYAKVLTDAIMTAERIDKNGENFEDVLIVTKRRQTTSVLVDVLMSPNFILLKPNKQLPASMTVFCAKDLKGDGKLKVFIDVTNTLQYKDGFWTVKNADVFVANLVTAATHLIYYTNPARITNNSRLTISGTTCFTDLFCYVLDYLRVSGYQQNKERVKYLVALYYQCGILWKDLGESTRNTAMKIADIDKRHADIAEMFMKNEPEVVFKDIDSFVKFLCGAFKFNDLTTEAFVDKWVYLISGHFALEVFPAFSRLITDTYSGAYITKQKTIEKVLGANIIKYTTDLFEIIQSAKGAHK